MSAFFVFTAFKSGRWGQSFAACHHNPEQGAHSIRTDQAVRRGPQGCGLSGGGVLAQRLGPFADAKRGEKISLRYGSKYLGIVPKKAFPDGGKIDMGRQIGASRVSQRRMVRVFAYGLQRVGGARPVVAVIDKQCVARCSR